MPGTSTYGTPIPLDTDPAGDLALAQRNIVDALEAAWTAFTPAWTATGSNPVLGNGTLTGKYKRFGKTIIVRWVLTIGSTSTFGVGSWLLSTPFTAHADYSLAGGADIGQATLRDLSAGSRVQRHVVIASPGSNVVLSDDAGGNALAGTPWVWANGDAIVAEAVYEAA